MFKPGSLSRFLLLGVSFAILTYLYGGYMQIHGPRSYLTLGYGVAAVAFLMGVGAWMLRRRIMGLACRLRLGSSRTWLRLHVVGGSFFLLMVLMHTRFQLPRGTFTLWLWVLSLWTVLSGWGGLMLQRWIPKVLADGLAVEVIYERIPELVGEVAAKADELVADAQDVLRTFYQHSVAPGLAAPHPRAVYFLNITGGLQAYQERFAYVRGFLDDTDKERLDKLQQLLRTKLEIDAHFTLQRATRWWLFLHVPPSILLVALVVLHIFTVYYY